MNPAGSLHVLEHVAGEADIHAGVGQRQPVAVTDHAGPARGTVAVQLTGIRLDQKALGAAITEGGGEVPRAAADVHDLAAAQCHVAFHQGDRVARQQGVEAAWIGLLAGEGRQQAKRTGRAQRRSGPGGGGRECTGRHSFPP